MAKFVQASTTTVMPLDQFHCGLETANERRPRPQINKRLDGLMFVMGGGGFSAGRRKWQAGRLRYSAARTIRKSAGNIVGSTGIVRGV